MRSAHIRARPPKRVAALTRETQQAGLPRENFVGGTILLVEAQQDDVVSIRAAFANANFLNPLQVAPSSDEAIAYLQGEGKYADRQVYRLPALVLLDLETPRKEGFEVLRWIRQHPELRSLRVIVLTGPNSVGDINRAYQLGANSFLIKPFDLTEFVDATRTFKGYWIWMSEQPKG